MNAPYFNLITSCSKNGKHIIIDSLSITSEHIHEIYSIAIEGNLTYLILNDPCYYQLFKPFSKEINNPFYIEMEVQNNNESEKDLPTEFGFYTVGSFDLRGKFLEFETKLDRDSVHYNYLNSKITHYRKLNLPPNF